MKVKLSIIAGLLALLAVTGCATEFGVNPKGPSAVENKLYTTVTNYVTATVNQTNTVTVTNIAQVTVTNTVGQVIPITVTNTVQQVQIIPVTVTNQAITMTTAPSTAATIQAGGAIINGFAPGIGSMVSAGLLALFGLWGHLRSSKAINTSAAIAQEVETLREFIQTLPQGAKYDTAITAWLQAHQMETGTAQQVLGLLANNVDNPAAKAAAAEIQNTLAALQKP